MKKYYKLFIILLLISFIVPQIALASWWNPFSWGIWNKIFHKATNNIQTTEIKKNSDDGQKKENTTPTQLNDTTVATTCSPDWVCGSWSICTDSLQTRKCADANSCGITTNKPKEARSCTSPQTQTQTQTQTPVVFDACKNIEGIQSTIPVGMNGDGNGNCTTPIQTPTQQTPTGKNYYYDSLSRVNSLLAIYRSTKTWLQDTSNQFRTAVNTLSGKGGGGAYGELRDATIKLANANISVISSLQTNTEQWISYWEGSLDVLKAHPEQFVNESTFNSLKSPESVQSDIESVKSKINADLDSVLSGITSLN